MRMQFATILLSGVATTLSACGGGGDSGGPPPVVMPPAPTPTPTPNPAPTAVYPNPYSATENRGFTSDGVFVSYVETPSPTGTSYSQEGVPVAERGGVHTQGTVHFRYTAPSSTDPSVAVVAGEFGSTAYKFEQGLLNDSRKNSQSYLRQNSGTDVQIRESLEYTLIKRKVARVVYIYSRAPYVPTPGATNMIQPGPAVITRRMTFVGPYTQTNEIPVGGRSNYSGEISTYGAFTCGGAMNFEVNWATGQLQLMPRSIGPGIDPAAQCHQLQFSIRVDGNDKSINGTVSSADGQYTGRVFGRFYGPRAASIALYTIIERGDERSVGGITLNDASVFEAYEPDER